MKQLLFATTNASKLSRFKSGLNRNNIELVSLKDANIDIDVNEDGSSAIDNALIKVREYTKHTNLPTIAMDDSLYIEGVPNDKQPGMFVRRVNGKRLNDKEMIDYYSALARDYGKDGKLVTRWVYGMAYKFGEIERTYTWSKSNFYIVSTPSSIINEGYPLNSISVNISLNKYFTDMTEKDWASVQSSEDHVVDFIVNCMNINQ